MLLSLRELHWLPVRVRRDLKILLITFKILQGLAARYLMNLVSILPALHYQLHWNDNGILLVSPRFSTKKTMGDCTRLWWQPQYCGTAFVRKAS